jgi:hypothetical protein
MTLPNSDLEFTPLQDSHVFKCEVNGQPLMGSIKAEYNNGNLFAYHVIFSDGFKAIFTASENGWEIEKDAKLYLQAIQNELNKFVAIQAINIMDDMKLS